MSFDRQQLTDQIDEIIAKLPFLSPEELPDIELYMDQVTSIMERSLDSSKRHPTDKLLTKTMINNYAKNHLLPPPERKKYTREHLLILIYIYYFKGFLSMQDIQAVLKPLADRYYHSDGALSVEEIYGQVFGEAKAHLPQIRTQMEDYVSRCSGLFADKPENDRDFLQVFSLICSLSLDVYIKKRFIEELIDHSIPQTGD